MIAALKRLGAFEVLYALKSGGMGDVLLARRRGPGGFEQLVAVKTIRAELMASQAVRDMFLDEARLLARLAHPAIATVLDFGEEEGVLYLAMEYVRGIAFRELVARRPPPEIAARAIAEACRGLHAAHELADLAGTPLGVVHRDISPENLMLGFDGQVKVLDFGIALVKGRTTVTDHGTVKGKPPYMSPEQVRGMPLDRRSDVFSVALVLHELLTGAPVFKGEHLYTVAHAVVEQTIVPPSQAGARALPPGLDDAVMRALIRDRDTRTPTAAALAEDLERLAGGESLEAWSARSLDGDREAHRAWLADVLGGSARPIGRPSGVITAASRPAPRPEPSPTPAPPAPSRRHHLGWLVLLFLLLGGTVAVLFRDSSAPSAAPPDAAPVAVVSAPPDAGAVLPVVIADAAPSLEIAVDAGPSRKRPRIPLDAGVRIDAAAPPIDAAAPAAAAGFVTITAKPFVLVHIDGKDLGTTPIYRRRISAGSHTIELISPDDGTVRLRRTLDIAPGVLSRIDL